MILCSSDQEKARGKQRFSLDLADLGAGLSIEQNLNYRLIECMLKYIITIQ